MDLEHFPSDAKKILQEVLGYLNFSSGNPDPRFLQGVNHLFGLAGEILGQAAKAQRSVCRVMADTFNSPFGLGQAGLQNLGAGLGSEANRVKPLHGPLQRLCATAAQKRTHQSNVTRLFPDRGAGTAYVCARGTVVNQTQAAGKNGFFQRVGTPGNRGKS